MEPKSPLAKCNECPLINEPVVHGTGPQNPKFVAVGEAPGRDEARHGVPFVGKSGQLLDRILQTQGVNKSELYLTNTVLCRPPNNRTPTAKEIKCCRERLVAEIKSKSPQAILGLGAVASKTLLSTSDAISYIREQGRQWSEELQAFVVPTFHPAATFRMPDLFPSIVSDVRKMVQPAPEWEPTKWVAPMDVTQAIKLLEKQASLSDGFLTCDIEIDEPYDRHNPIWLCIGISHAHGKSAVYPKHVVDNEDFQKEFAQLLDDETLEWGWQNGKFDIQYLWKFAPGARVDQDSMLLSYAVDERKGVHSLEQLGVEYLGTPYWKRQARALTAKGKSLSSLDPKMLWQYNATDVDVTRRLFEPLRKEAEADGVYGVYEDILIPAANTLAKVEYKGITIDLAYVDELETRLTKEYQEAETHLKQWVENPRSNPQVKAALESLLGEEIENTRKPLLQEIRDSTSNSELLDFTERMLEHRDKHKKLSTYIKGMKKRLCPTCKNIHSTFNIHGTETGRLSSSNPNMQNIPIGFMRGMFTASTKDRVLVEADFSGIELRVGALLLNDPWLLENLQEGSPAIHKTVATELYGGDYTERQYIDGKSVTFGIFYNRQAPAIAAQLGISVQAAQKIINDWIRRCPTLPKYWKSIEEEIKTKGHLKSYYGRVRRFWLITYENIKEIFREGYNFPIQSWAGDICLKTLIVLLPMLPKDIWPVVTVHDSINLDCPISKVEEAKGLVNGAVKKVTSEFAIPMPVDFKVNYRWGQHD